MLVVNCYQVRGKQINKNRNKNMKNKIYTVTNPTKTNWIKGAKVRRLSPWQKDGALFTNAEGAGPAIWASQEEVTKG
tara:strand:- start:1098 stop:1328 length:231 start_codon:yes stop_codon:yes gene_type:complete